MQESTLDLVLHNVGRQLNAPFMASSAVIFLIAGVIVLWMRASYKGYGRLERINSNVKPFYRAMVALAIVYFLVYSFASVQRYNKLLCGAWDLGIFHSLMTNALHGRFFQDYRGPFDHYQPALALFLPFYALWQDPRCLLVLQTAGIAIAVWPLYLLVRDVSGKPVLAAVIGMLYLLYPFLGAGNIYDFHGISLTPVAFFGMLLFMWRRRWGWYWVFFVFLLLTKESEAILAFGAGLYLLSRWDLIGKRRAFALDGGGSVETAPAGAADAADARWTRRVFSGEYRTNVIIGGVTVVVSTIWFFLSTKVLLPWMSGAPFRHFGRYAGYDELLRWTAGTQEGQVTAAAYAARLVAVLAFCAVPVGFLILRRWRPVVLIWGPYFAVNAVSRAVYQNIFYGHYTLTVAAAILGATALATEGIRGWSKDDKPSVLPVFLLIVGALSNLLFSWPASHRLLYPAVHLYMSKSFNVLGLPLPFTKERAEFYRIIPHERLFLTARHFFPEGSTIATQNSLGYFFAVGYKLVDFKQETQDFKADYYLFDLARGDSMHTPPDTYKYLLNRLDNDPNVVKFLDLSPFGGPDFVFYAEGDKWLDFYRNALEARRLHPGDWVYSFIPAAVEKTMGLPPSEPVPGTAGPSGQRSPAGPPMP